ncbi:MAG TPA: hypothetical protein VFW73_14005 [Lacipirellulaceae bacterium]|nr:hypothetical protein [Lacipirellulaceae bacterium]
MTVCNEIADYEWLTGREADALLGELAADTLPLHTAVSRLRRRLTQNRTHLLIEQVELRRRAAAKFTQAHRMFFTRIGLEQATDDRVACYKAARFASAGWIGKAGGIVDLCCGIGGDLAALAGITPAIGIDREGVTAHFASANTGTAVHALDVKDFDLSSAAAFHMDPDRRPTGRRTTSIETCEPNRVAIERLLQQVPNAAIKLAPATEVPIDWQERCELEWISRGRECRQLVAWHGELARGSGKCSATILSAARRFVPRTIAGEPKQPVHIVEKPDRYVFDVDPAVLAAKLNGALAAEHQLDALGDGPTYFTGPSAIDDPALSCFQVDEVVPFQLTILAKHLSARRIGQLEIKKRNIDVDPEKLRCQLKLRGSNNATLLITRVAGRPTAILSRRLTD